MARAVTSKTVQVHLECACGYNCVYEDYFHIPYSELTHWKIVRKRDKKTGTRWLFFHQKVEACESCAPLD